jgi:CRP-like cAMP-binding protein
MLLRRVPLFADLSAAEYAHIAAVLREQRYKKHAVIFHANDPGNALFLLTTGTLQMTVETADARAFVLGQLYPGDFFGEMALLDSLPRSATVTALEASETLVLMQETFVDLLQRTPALTRRIAETFSRRLRNACDLVRSLAFLDAHGKVARVLFKLSIENGRVTPPGATLEMRLTQNAVARFAGVTRETAAHVLHDFQQAGYVRTTRGVIMILEQAMLARLGHVSPPSSAPRPGLW